MSAFSTTSAVGLVATKDVWVEAQMKETDLTLVKPGQPVDVEVDTYPGRTWHGTVEAISAATSGAFSVLPAENASGNWVKVQQRVPLKVKITQKPGDPELRAGMSAEVSIDTGSRRWHQLLFGN
jgi:membrane fusion protein, multidrug efflux system